MNNPRQRIVDSEDSEPTEKTVEMPQGIYDFTIVLHELTNMAACELKVYDGLDRLWRDGRKIQDDSSHRNQSGSLACIIGIEPERDSWGIFSEILNWLVGTDTNHSHMSRMLYSNSVIA